MSDADLIANKLAKNCGCWGDDDDRCLYCQAGELLVSQAAALAAADERATEEYRRGFMDGLMDEWNHDELRADDQ